MEHHVLGNLERAGSEAGGGRPSEPHMDGHARTVLRFVLQDGAASEKSLPETEDRRPRVGL